MPDRDRQAELTAIFKDADALRAYFRERGWSIHMEDNGRAVIDPFAAIIESVADATQPPADSEGSAEPWDWNRDPDTYDEAVHRVHAAFCAPEPTVVGEWDREMAEALKRNGYVIVRAASPVAESEVREALLAAIDEPLEHWRAIFKAGTDPVAAYYVDAFASARHNIEHALAAAAPPAEHGDGDTCTGIRCANPEHGWADSAAAPPASGLPSVEELAHAIAGDSMPLDEWEEWWTTPRQLAETIHARLASRGQEEGE